MSIKYNLNNLLLVPVFLCVFCSTGQGVKNIENKYYNWFDEMVGVENYGLYQGTIYIEKYRTINDKTKFFKSFDFLSGSVVYSGQPYFDVDLKYDVFGDDLLLRLPNNVGGNTLKLFKQDVSSFVIDGHSFVNLDVKTNLDITGFCEVILTNGHLSYFIKHFKKDYSRKERGMLYYEFVDDKDVHILHFKNEYHIIKKKKDLISIFPDYRTDIDFFYRDHRSLQNKDFKLFLKSLLGHLGMLLSEETNRV